MSELGKMLSFESKLGLNVRFWIQVQGRPWGRRVILSGWKRSELSEMLNFHSKLGSTVQIWRKYCLPFPMISAIFSVIFTIFLWFSTFLLNWAKLSIFSQNLLGGLTISEMGEKAITKASASRAASYFWVRKMSEPGKMLSFESTLGLNVRFESKSKAAREGGELFLGGEKWVNLAKCWIFTQNWVQQCKFEENVFCRFPWFPLFFPWFSLFSSDFPLFYWTEQNCANLKKMFFAVSHDFHDFFRDFRYFFRDFRYFPLIFNYSTELSKIVDF